jgi:hypothetical protein
MSPSCRLLRVVSALVLFLLLMTGCRPAMSDPTTATTTPTIQPPAPTHEVPLHFVRHDFEAHCYNSIGCKIAYAGRYQINDAPDKVSGPPPADRNEAWGPGEGPIRNFPPPAEVTWKSLDGVAHDAKVDLASIFKDGLIWHKVPKADMADFYRGPVAGDPDIHLEVNDRTINVYMTMLIPTRTQQNPKNKDSYDRSDLFLVWTRTY